MDLGLIYTLALKALNPRMRALNKKMWRQDVACGLSGMTPGFWVAGPSGSGWNFELLL